MTRSSMYRRHEEKTAIILILNRISQKKISIVQKARWGDNNVMDYVRTSLMIKI